MPTGWVWVGDNCVVNLMITPGIHVGPKIVQCIAKWPKTGGPLFFETFYKGTGLEICKGLAVSGEPYAGVGLYSTYACGWAPLRKRPIIFYVVPLNLMGGGPKLASISRFGY